MRWNQSIRCLDTAHRAHLWDRTPRSDLTQLSPKPGQQPVGLRHRPGWRASAPSAPGSVAPSLPEPLHCPLCAGRLSRDPLWLSCHWLCENGHSYSNVEVLIAELHERE